jgi:competence protein ComEC
LLSGDIGAQTEKELLPSLENVDVLKIGHHGSNGSSSSELLVHLQPVLSVISVGAGNPYGHPGLKTLGRLRGTRILRTDREGTIEVQSDGQHLSWRSLW